MENTQEGMKWERLSSIDIRYRGTETAPKESANVEKTVETVSAISFFHHVESSSERRE